MSNYVNILRKDINITANTSFTTDLNSLILFLKQQIFEPPSYIYNTSQNYVNILRKDINITANTSFTTDLNSLILFLKQQIFDPPNYVEYVFPLKVQRSILPPNSQDENQGYIRNRLSLDLTDTNLNSTFLLACELDISGISQTNSINQPYNVDAHVDSTNVTPDSNFDTFITFGSFDANDSNYNKPDNDLILPTDSFDSTNNNATGTASYQFNSSGVRNILWAKRNIALENITNNTEYPIAQIVIKDNENGTFHFIYGKGVLGPDQEGIDIQGVINQGRMEISNYNYEPTTITE